MQDDRQIDAGFKLIAKLDRELTRSYEVFLLLMNAGAPLESIEMREIVGKLICLELYYFKFLTPANKRFQGQFYFFLADNPRIERKDSYYETLVFVPCGNPFLNTLANNHIMLKALQQKRKFKKPKFVRLTRLYKVGMSLHHSALRNTINECFYLYFARPPSSYAHDNYRQTLYKRFNALGSYQEVFDGVREKTKGGLSKNDLMLNKRGKVVSKKRHEIGLQRMEVLSKYKKPKKEKPEEKVAEEDK
ncbi:hypothetical protein RFI_20584 [Reticulomyxa filosa]|uniref:Uncharacterized protein n=1 Tax=Reticulomyxa filosa TaxID=46433 RepID=X6MSW0_RETFI|nr:hypothetical protein RFI_20584 [Reticulomyxa filosa]|eukprot:ETO16756.1 hypothetical protein RFI_20584 [Reticulomyxa filosa]